MLFLTSCNFVENTSTIKELLPLISPLIVILLFGIERYLSYKIRKKERDRQKNLNKHSKKRSK